MRGIPSETDPTRSGRGPYRKGVRRRQEIVRAAAEVFAEVGYNGGSLRSISERVGVSSASLVQYFGSKEGLLAAVLEEWARQSRPAGAAGLRGVAWIRSIRDAMVYNSTHRGLVELFLTLTAEASNPGHPARPFIQHRYAAIIAELSQHLREAVEVGDVHLTEDQLDREVRLFFATMDGIELQWLLDPTLDLLDLFDHHLDSTLTRWARPQEPQGRTAS